MVKLTITKSSKKDKRFKAVFKYDDGKTKTTNFGFKGGSTYIDHKDKKIRSAYRARHKKDLDTKDYQRAGYLSYYILWGDETNLKDAIESYKKRFNLS